MTLQAGAMKAAAHDLAARGWAVFPVTVGGKAPITKNGHLNATTEPGEIEVMWQGATFANVGIFCERSRLYVIDVDMNPWKHKVGQDTWTRLMAEHGHVPTFTVRTWSGGLHYYYRMPAGMNLTNTSGTGNGTGRGLGVDIDTRGNGYVLAPGSRVSEDGHVGWYTIEHDLEVADLPQWVIDAVTREPKAALAGLAPVAGHDLALERLQALAATLENAPEGEGNATAARVAYMAGQYAGAGQIERDQAIAILLDAVSGWSWHLVGDAATMDNTITRQVDAGMGNPRPWERAVAPHTAPVVLAAQPVLPDPFTVEQEPDDPEEEADREVSMWSTDNGQGVFLRDRVRDMLYAVGVGWMVWDGKRWKRVDIAVIKNKVSRFYRDQFGKMLKKYIATMDSKWNDLAKAYRAYMSSARLGSILNHLMVTDGVLVDAGDLDTHKDLLNTPGGVVNLRTGTIAPHDRTLLFTKITRGSYRPGLTHPDWDMALTALPVEQADYIQLRLGQATTGYIPESDDAVFLVGHGANGKSLITSEGAFRALGDYADLAQATLISKTTEGSGPTPERFGLRGCRFVLIEELPEGRALSIAEVKRITGMSVITARDVYEKQVTFDASHTLFITTNFLPPVAEVDEGSWRRFVLIPFPFRFRTKPEAPEDRQGDPGLKSRLREGEDGQHDAILTWLVAGAMRYFADRAAIMDDRRPAAIATATMAWREEADRILAYLNERITFDPERAIVRGHLYDDFTEFLKERGHAVWSAETFHSRFKAHEKVRNAEVSDMQTRIQDNLSLPVVPGASWSSGVKPVKAVNRVYRGIAFNPS